MSVDKKDFYSLSLDALSAWLVGMGEAPFHARQVFHWAYQQNARTFAEMTNVSKTLRESLDAAFEIGPLPILKTAKGGDTTKLLLGLADSRSVECVRIAMRKADTACVSSQVGCSVRCAFCATGQTNCERSLTTGEMVRQVISLNAAGANIGNIVFMGMGEPFHNYEGVVAAVRRFIDPAAFGISASRVTVSTAGIVPMIRRYAQEGLPTELAVSLNAPTDGLRRKLMPGVTRWPLDELLPACREFSEAHRGQPVTFAYVLLDGVNDDFDQAELLARLVRGQPHHVNLIPMNKVTHSSYKAPPNGRIQAFLQKLRAMHVNVSLRQSKGGGIEAACGQLKVAEREAGNA